MLLAVIAYNTLSEYAMFLFDIILTFRVYDMCVCAVRVAAAFATADGFVISTNIEIV